MKDDPSVPVLPDETLDTMFEGKLKIIQKKKGYRFSLDAVILGRLAPVSPGDRVLDLGTGCGIMPLIVTRSTEAKEVVGVELQEELADIARRNVSLNGLTDIITIVKEDLNNLASLYPEKSFDLIISNPPFRKLNTGRVSSGGQKAIARHEVAVSLKKLLEVACRLLKKNGKIFLVYPAFRLIDLLFEMRNADLEPKTIQCVHSRRHGPAKMVLVEGFREGGVEVEIKEPLVIYDSEKNYTEALQKIYSFP